MIGAPRERVFEALWDSEHWPGWWPGLESAVETCPGDAAGIGRRGRYSFRSGFGYSVSFDAVSTAVERPHLLEAEVGNGFDGHGRWLLSEKGTATRIDFSWQVRPARGWMRTAGRLLAPVLGFAHDRVMDAGARGLAGYLGAELISADNG